MFARAIISKPNVLILDEAFGGMEESMKLDIVKALYSEKNWTIIDISHDAELIRRSECVYVLDKGRIVVGETCAPLELAQKSNTLFGELFPDLVRQLCQEKVTTDLAEKSIKLTISSAGTSNDPNATSH
jgi:ABC-type glutathione transport system ATPase component